MIIGDALDMKILLGVEEASDVLDFVGAIPESGTADQDMCVPTLDFDAVDFSRSPYFEVGPVDMPISLMGVSLTVSAMNINGTFEPDGGAMNGVGLAGSLDMREVGPALSSLGDALPFDLSDPDDACDTLSLLGISCVECPSDGSEYCLTLVLSDIEALATGTPVEVLTEDDISEECP
jgi:hypothetical protein